MVLEVGPDKQETQVISKCSSAAATTTRLNSTNQCKLKVIIYLYATDYPDLADYEIIKKTKKQFAQFHGNVFSNKDIL